MLTKIFFSIGRYQAPTTLHWRLNERDGVSNHRRFDCLLNRFFRRKSKKTSKLRLVFVRGIHRWPMDSQKGPVTWKTFPFDVIIMMSQRVHISSGSYDILEPIITGVTQGALKQISQTPCHSVTIRYKRGDRSPLLYIKGLFYLHNSSQIKVWISNYIYIFLYDMYTQPCPHFTGGLAKPLVKWRHGWVIIYQEKIWVYYIFMRIANLCPRAMEGFMWQWFASVT